MLPCLICACLAVELSLTEHLVQSTNQGSYGITKKQATVPLYRRAGPELPDVCLQSSSSGGDGFTNELVEAALAELEEEDAERAASGSLSQLPAGGKPPMMKPGLISSGSLEKEGSFSRNSSKGLSDETQSPIRVTPAASRQVGFICKRRQGRGNCPSEI